MESDLSKVCATSVLSGCYCYAISKTTKKGVLRFLLLLPVAAFFAAAPYSLLSHRHLSTAAWFFLTGLGIPKLLLFSFDAGPLAAARYLPLPHFVCALLLPVQIRPGLPAPARVNPTGLGVWAAKLAGLGCVVWAYGYGEGVPFWGLIGLYCCHVYLSLEIVFALCGALVTAFLGLELASQADEPYLSSSLQDFWGRRWNLMVSDMLRQIIHNPLRGLTTPFIGKKNATLVGVFASFLVSGLVHELVYTFLTRAPPTWEVTWFFVLQGACLVIELIIKTMINNKWRLHRVVSRIFTIGFVAITAAWLFFPPLLRNNVPERFVEEYAVFGSYLKKNVFRHQQTPS